ncbi:BEACH domain-containing protein [Cavenderia fasciculata]|uniref:BEACH domain-containing protein n=1 Tax=Cavenderia fasciculata TaxID=261658 RepID=F4Q969_CACFS|nr:BEACH domain-containing protein [Cavenderia fasciculata]EGG15238.1 BEACH domain-containing protein [Cavenderia fasciculata]|eukprot:XP_004351958.1 BEACH domain-containing protein [Cavenderia fasciculata]
MTSLKQSTSNFGQQGQQQTTMSSSTTTTNTTNTTTTTPINQPLQGSHSSSSSLLSSPPSLSSISTSLNNNNNNTVRLLWNSYVQTVVYQESLFTLVDFLKLFTTTYQDTPRHLLSLSFGSPLGDITRILSKHLIQELNSASLNNNRNTTTSSQQQQQQQIINNGNNGNIGGTSGSYYNGSQSRQLLQQSSTSNNNNNNNIGNNNNSGGVGNGIFNYLSGYSLAGEAPLLLLALDILTRHSCEGVPISLVKLIAVLLNKIITSTSSPLPYNTPPIATIPTTINSSSTTSSSSALLPTMSTFNPLMGQRNLSSKISVNIPSFPTINSYFFLPPLPPSIYNDQSVQKQSPLPQTNNNNNVTSASSPTFTTEVEITTTSSLNHEMEIKPIGGDQTSSSSASSTSSTPLTNSLTSIPASIGMVDDSSSSSNNNNNNNNIVQQQWKTTNDLSPTVNICFQLLKILGNIIKDQQILYELLISDSGNYLELLTDILTHQSTDPTFSIIQIQIVRIFAQIMSTCCISSDSMSFIHDKKIIEKLLNVLNIIGERGDKKNISISILIELSQVIIYTIKSSSRLMVSLHDDFDTNNGYSILLNTFVHIADNGTLKNKLDIINVACNLLFISLRKEFLIDSDSIYQPNNIAKTSLKIFNIFLNVFTITKSEETKTELLKCMKGIFYLSLFNDSYSDVDTATDDNIGVFHQLEPFQIFFTQFDNLNIHNRKLILEMMDELLLKNQIKRSEIFNYVSLFNSKLPSTILLVFQHLTDLLAKSKINKEILKEAGFIKILCDYLSKQNKLAFFQVLMERSDELQLCIQLIPGKHFQQSNNKLFVLYRIITSALNLLLEFFSSSPDVQNIFVEKHGGLRLLYGLLHDECLIQPALQVLSNLAIGKLRIESKIIKDLIAKLQSSGGIASLDSEILTQRKHILAAMCFIFHNNHAAKMTFKEAGGFTWCVSILDGIGRCVKSSNQDIKIKSNSNNNEIFFFLKVLIDTLSAVMKNNPMNQIYFKEHIPTLSNTLKACGYMEGLYSASLCDSLLNMAVSGSWPPSCEQHSLEEGSLLSIYSPISSFFPTNSPLNISPNATIEKLPFLEQEYLDSPIIDSNNNNNNNFEPLQLNSNDNLDSSSTMMSPNRKGRTRSYTNDFSRLSSSTATTTIFANGSNHHSGATIDHSRMINHNNLTQSSLDLAAESRGSNTIQVMSSFSRLPEKSSLHLAQDRYQSCQSCRESLMIENPEIFRLIIRLMGGSEEDILKIETKSSCYILREIIFLASLSLTNQKKLSSFLIDIVDYLRPLLISNNTLKKKSDLLKPLILELIQSLGSHSLSLAEFRKYFELLRVRDYPLDLLNLLGKISNRDNIPTYYAEFSNSALECIDFPSWGEKSWPPLKGYGISLWFRYTQPTLKINKSSIFLLSIEGIIIGSKDKSCESQLQLDKGVLTYRIIHNGTVVEQFSFSEFTFEPDQFYHLCLTHTGSQIGQKKSPIKLFVNGCCRSQYVLSYPKTQQMTLCVRFGGPNAASYFQDYSMVKTNWHLGNAYFFEDLPSEKEIFYLYLLGPDHFRGLKVDISSIENIRPYMDKTTKLHPLLIEHLLNPTMIHLFSLHDKIVSIFSAKCLYVTKSHRIMNKSEAITHVSAQPQQALNDSSTSSSIRRSSSMSEKSFTESLSERSSIYSSNGGGSIDSNSRNSISRRDSKSLLTDRDSITQSIGSAITHQHHQHHQQQQQRLSSSSFIQQSSLLPPLPPSSTPTPQQSIVNNTLSILQTGLPLPLPYGVISQRSLGDLVSDSGGVSVIIYLIAVSSDKEYQKSALRLLQSIVQNNQQNIKDMKDIYGYQLVSHIIRKNNWTLDDGLLSILFSFVGVQSTRTSSHYYDGVVQDVLALKHFLLEWDIWRHANLVDQKKLFESLEKLVNPLHDNHDFNIIKFRQAGAFETILKICKEEDLPLEVVSILMSILRSIKHKSARIKEDFQLIMTYLFETSPKGKPTSNSNSSNSTHRRKKSTSNYLIQAVHNNNSSNSNSTTEQSYSSSTSSSSGSSTPHEENVRVSVLTLLLDILSKSEITVVEEFHSLCSLESIFGLIVNETIATRILFIKIIDLYLHIPSILALFQKMKGFHLLGHQLHSNHLTEDIFGILFCILFGKPYNSDIDPTLSVSMNMYLLGQISSDIELKYPGVIATILIILQGCSSKAQHIVIKMIHNIFLQNDQFKQTLLDQDLIPRLVDILSSNFTKRSAAKYDQFNRNILKDIENISSSSSNNSTSNSFDKEDSWQAEESILSILKEIALYGSKTQEPTTLLRDILVILHLNSKMDFEYICCLQRRILYDVISFFNENDFGLVGALVSSFEKICILSINTLCYQEKTILMTKRGIGSAFKLSSSSTSSNAISNYLSPLRSSNHGGDSTPTTPNLSSHHHHPRIPTSPETSDISNNEQTITSNDESTEESDSSSYDGGGSNYRQKKSIIPIWIKEGHLFNPESFITLLINVLSNHKIPTSQNSTYKSLFTTQYSAKSLLGKLIHLLLTSNEFNDYQSLVLSLLVGGGDTLVPINEMLSEEDLIVLLYVTYRFVNNDICDQYKLTIKLWNLVYKGATQEFLKKAFDFSNWSTTDVKEVVNKFQFAYAEGEFKKWEERNNQQKREWKLQYLETQKNKQSIIIKNQDTSKMTKNFSNSLLTLKTKYQHSSLQTQSESSDTKRFLTDQWKLLIKRVTHERAIWELPPDTNKWKLDPTEGTNRMRTRLKRITLKSKLNISIPELNDNNNNSNCNNSSNNNTLLEINNEQEEESISNLTNDQLQQSTTTSLHDSYSSFDQLKIGERLEETYSCSSISPFYQRDGELLIGELNIYFRDELLTIDSNSGNNNGKKSKKVVAGGGSNHGKHITMSYEDVIEIHKRRHVLKNNAIEIFLGSGVPHKTYLFAFPKPSDRDIVYDLIMSKPLPNRVDYAAEAQGNILKMSITKKWQRGLISNFEYLMHLNTLAGRSFNDLTQYPIFPFILRDYESNELDLEKPETFRDLSKPMGAQDPARLKKFQEKYNYLQENNETPYHYGSHYSNIGSVLHFLVRVQPFASYFIEFQGGRFDVPDRAFHSITQTWKLSSSISSSDVKELIPEFFYLPDFLANNNNFNMGCKQDGIRVDNVVLPPWANNDPKLFIKKHLEALESKYVSENLHNWIDLMFGYKQHGEAAVKACNVFHPLTYEGAVDIDSIEDQLLRDATIAQIHSYGQTPKQIFTKAHPQRNWKKTTKLSQDAIYTHPEKLTNYTMWSIRNPVGSIGLADTPIPLPPQRILLYPDTNKYVSWGHWDQNLRITLIDTGKVLSLVEVNNDDIICCDITKNGRLFVTGGTSGTIKVWKRCNSDGTVMTRKERGDNLSLWSQLYGHTHSILCITVSQEFSTIISGSKDHTCIIWDLNRLTYVRSLQHEYPVTCVQVSPTTNYIVTVATNVTGENGILRLWNPNGELLASRKIQNDKINCMTFSTAFEGVVQNFIVTGMESGALILWDSTTLTKIRTLQSSTNNKAPITAISVSKDHTQLISGDANGLLECWSTKLFDGYSAVMN